MPRKRKPNEIHEISGTHRSNVHETEDARTTVAAKIPDWLVDQYALECWHTLVPMLEEIGLLVGTDSDCVGRYCTAQAHYRRAQEEMAKDGATVAGGNGGLKNHPAWTRAKDAGMDMHRLSVVLGLSPSDRAALGDRNVGAPPKDDFAVWEESA